MRRWFFSQEAEGAQAWFRLTLEEDKTYGFSYSFDGRNFYRIEYSFPLKSCHMDRCKTLPVVLLTGKTGSLMGIAIMSMWN